MRSLVSRITGLYKRSTSQKVSYTQVGKSIYVTNGVDPISRYDFAAQYDPKPRIFYKVTANNKNPLDFKPEK